MKNVEVNSAGVFAVYVNGELDIEQSTKKFVHCLNMFDMIKHTNKAKIASCVAVIFDKWRGQAIPKDLVVTSALFEIKADLDTIEEYKAGILSYLKNNTGPKDSALFGIKPGAGYIKWSHYHKT
jgi:hypothetical protein